MLVNLLFYFFTLISLVLGFLYVRFRQRASYWVSRGVPTPSECSFPFGTDPRMCKTVFFRKKNVGDVTEELYMKFKEHRYFGTNFFLGRPVLVVTDPDLIKDVMVKDFSHFVDRRVDKPFAHSTTLADKIWNKQITTLKGEEWKEVRATLSPFFTSGKLRAMTPLMRVTAQHMLDKVEQHRVKGQEVNFKELCGTFVMSTLASCAFGIDLTKGDPGRFKQSVYNILSRPPKDFIKVMTTLFVPGGRSILNALGVSISKEEETVFFYNAVRDAMTQRKEGKVPPRNDLIDQMIKVVANDLDHTMEDEDEEELKGLDVDFVRRSRLDNRPRATPSFGDLDVAALAIVFMVAGYDTSSTTLTFLLYELARHPEVQEQVYNEIVEVCGTDLDQDVTYEQVNGLEYLDMAFYEALRLHAPAALLVRACVEDYRIDDNVTVPKDMEVFIPVSGIHHDERHYPEPFKFDINRFSKEQKATRSPYTFFGFGQGPRSCIGTRFALIEAKIGVTMLLRKYRVLVGMATPTTVSRDPVSSLGCPKEEIVLKVELR